MIDILFIGTFNSWVICQTSKKKENDLMSKKDFFYIIFNHFDFPLNIITIYSVNLKKIT